MKQANSLSISIPDALERTNKGPLVLLFYDGYERRAEPGVIGGLRSQARRYLRYAKRRLCGQQLFTGFYTAFLGLQHCLEAAGCDVRVNDYAAADKRPNYPIGIAGYPSVLDKVQLPNPRMFGPGDFGLPDAAQAVAKDSRFKRLIQPSEWFADMYRPVCGDKMFVWFAGIDTQRWHDFSAYEKEYDFVVYDKIRWHRDERVPSILNRITKHLDATNKRYKVVRYGHHALSEFVMTLKASKALLFVCEHETQGLAYQEAMAANIPVLAWDEGEMVDPMLKPFMRDGLAVSSVPYFSDACGKRFRMQGFEATCDAFCAELGSYQPREYVKEALSYHASAKLYLDEYARLIRSARSRQTAA
jgi:glycosyltransferase involved in cell wall biosynthesis